MIRPYVETDYPQIVEWLVKRGISPKGKMDLPEIGYIEPGVGVGFMIKTDIRTAIIDFFISNPESSRRNRTRALDNILSRLIQHSRWIKVKTLTCSVNVEVSKKRAVKYGFKPIGEFTSFSKEL